MHVYTYYLETTGISQAHKKNVWEHGSENTWLGLFMQLWVRPVVGIGKAVPPSQQRRYYMRLQSRERVWH